MEWFVMPYFAPLARWNPAPKNLFHILLKLLQPPQPRQFDFVLIEHDFQVRNFLTLSIRPTRNRLVAHCAGIKFKGAKAKILSISD
jgi:hypothetical protein